eukprot:15352367-Ditylum_brightwellii.AAC.1
MVLKESGILHSLDEGREEGHGDDDDYDYDWSEFFDFWSLQNDGGYGAAKAHALEYFLRTENDKFVDKNGHHSQSCQPRNAQLFGIPWHERPISVGIMIDYGTFKPHNDDASDATSSSSLAFAVSNIVRLLSFLNVTPILPLNSPLISGAVDSKFVVDSAATTTPMIVKSKGLFPSSSGDMEDFFSLPQGNVSSSVHSNNPSFKNTAPSKNRKQTNICKQKEQR